MRPRRLPNPLPIAGSAGALLFSVLLYQGLAMNKSMPRFSAPGGPQEGVVNEAQGSPLKVLLLGESTVAGVGAPSHTQALCGSFSAMLAQETRRAVQWRAVGQNGVTAEACLQRLVPRLEGERPDFMMVALGVNDVVLLRGARRFSVDVHRLITEVRAHVGLHVPILFSGVPPMGSFPAFPQPLRSLAHVRSILLDRSMRRVVDRSPNTYHAPIPFKGGRAYFCDDGYHPSTLGYATWVEFLRPVARDVVTQHGLVRA